MTGRRCLRKAFAVFPVLLLVTAIASGLVFTRAERAFYGFHEADRPLIERSVRNLADAFGTRPDYFEKRTFPLVTHLADRTCIELPSTERYGTGYYRGCYDLRTGELIEERVSAGF